MNRIELKEYIMRIYHADADYPWMKHPGYEVFRHTNNRKWFALIMNVPKEKLGLPGEGGLDIANFKCDPILISSLRSDPGFFPAYHMNKNSWITAALDGSAGDDKIKMLLDMSFELTAGKIKKRRRQKIQTADRLQSGQSQSVRAKIKLRAAHGV